VFVSSSPDTAGADTPAADTSAAECSWRQLMKTAIEKTQSAKGDYSGDVSDPRASASGS
jgi:hypothetical protein